jgi:hypothetical protein
MCRNPLKLRLISIHTLGGVMKRNLVGVAVAAILLAGTTSCSISNSSETLSDSMSSPFDWSSSSSDSSMGDSAYRQDVSDYTVAFTRDARDYDAFRTGLRQLAETHGITNWEEDAFTCASVGLGLQRADLDRADALHFGEDLLGGNAAARRELEAGYASIP